MTTENIITNKNNKLKTTITSYFFVNKKGEMTLKQFELPVNCDDRLRQKIVNTSCKSDFLAMKYRKNHKTMFGFNSLLYKRFMLAYNKFKKLVEKANGKFLDEEENMNQNNNYIKRQEFVDKWSPKNKDDKQQKDDIIL